MVRLDAAERTAAGFVCLFGSMLGRWLLQEYASSLFAAFGTHSILPEAATCDALFHKHSRQVQSTTPAHGAAAIPLPACRMLTRLV
jgi:hypothetical protein